jgi:hypothetical protein
MFAGAEGDHFLITKATQAALEANHEYFLGLAAQDFANNQYGYVTQFGRLESMDTSDYTAGDILWFDSEGTVAGAITITEPAAPNTKIQIAAVVRVHQNEGVIFVRPTIYHTLSEQQDVLITSIADKDLLAWNSATGVWENTKTLGDITTGNITTSGTVDGVDVSAFKSAYDTHNHDDRYYTELEVDGFLANKANWDTAYSWGDHSIVGYLTSFTETDPVFSASASAGITSTQITNWDTAYGWGDHSTQSYATQTYVGNAIAALVDSAPATLDTLNELAAALGDDPNFATTVSNSIGTKWTQDNTKITQWDTAYGWGDHAGLYLPIGGGTLTGGITINGTITLPQNPVGTTYGNGVSAVPIYMIQQAAGDDDGIRLYAEAGVANDVRMIFEVVDDLETGDTWVFRNKKTYTDYTANEVVKISGSGDITASGTLSASGYNNTNWDTAFSWGNHASAGYLTAESDTLDSVLTRGSTTDLGFIIENGNSTYTNPETTNVPRIYMHNTGASATAHAVLSLRTLGGTGGNPFVSFDLNGVTGWSVGADNSDGDKFKISNNWAALDSNTRFTIQTTGEVGIGTTSPAHKLDVAGTTNSYLYRIAGLDGLSGYILPQGSWLGGGSTATNLSIASETGNGLAFFTNGTADFRMFINTSGNVGIGTTSPAHKLSVQGEIAKYTTTGVDGVFDSILRYGYFADVQAGSANTNRHHLIDGSLTAGAGSANKIRFKVYRGNLAQDQPPATVMTLSGDERVGIGTESPEHKLHVNGLNNDTSITAQTTYGNAAVRLRLINEDRSFIITNNPGDDLLSFFYGDSNRLQFNLSNQWFPSGNLGIGTTDFSQESFASSMLKVGGSRATLSLYSAGSLSTIAMTAGSDTTKSIHINQSDTGTFGIYQYSAAEETLLLNANGTLSVKAGGYFGQNIDGNSYISVSENQIWRTNNALLYINNSSAGDVSMVGGGGKVLINATSIVAGYATKLYVNAATQYAAAFDHAFVTSGENYADALFLANTNANDANYVSLGMATTGGDGQHHRFAIHAHKSAAGNYAGYAAFMLRQLDTGFPEKFRMNYNGDFHADGDVIAYSSTISDKRLKDDVKTIDNALDKVKSMRGVEYVWNAGSRKGQKDLGLIAQEVEAVLPEIVREKQMPFIDDSDEKYKTVDYEKIVGVLIEAIKELTSEVDELKAIINGGTK